MKRHPTPLRLALERIFVGAALCTVLALTFGGHASHAQSSRKKAMAVSAVDDIPFKPTVDTYTVQQGDTMWSISRKFVGSPWLWPRVWSYNPEINNPNWIYPGDTIRFYPSDVELPSMYDLASADRPIPAAPNEPLEMGPQRGGVDTSKYAGIFVTPKELAEAGTLRNSVDEHILFTRNDRVLVAFPKDAQPRSGERYFVYRTVGKVTHPITNKPYGYMTEVTGLASIEEVYEKSSKAKIEHTRLEVERGQYVSKYDEHNEKVTATKGPDNMEAYILAVNSDHGVVAGKSGIVFIDKGSNDGVQKGNQFSVLKTDDLITSTDNLPPKIVGTLMVIDAKETASTCLVTMAKQEIEPGQKVKTR